MLYSQFWYHNWKLVIYCLCSGTRIQFSVCWTHLCKLRNLYKIRCLWALETFHKHEQPGHNPALEPHPAHRDGPRATSCLLVSNTLDTNETQWANNRYFEVYSYFTESVTPTVTLCRFIEFLKTVRPTNPSVNQLVRLLQNNVSYDEIIKMV